MKVAWHSSVDWCKRPRWLLLVLGFAFLYLVYRLFLFLLTPELMLLGHPALAAADAGFVKVEDFNALTPGALNGQGGWSAGGAIQVVTDPVNAANRVMELRNGMVEAYKALPTPILDNSIGTIHFRLRRAGHIDGFAGTSDMAAPTDWSAFETQFGSQINHPADAFVARNGNSFAVLNQAYSDQRWLCVWMVADNVNNRYELYVKGGDLATPTKLSAGAQSVLAFRNGGSDPLRTFFTRLHQSSQGSLFLDDIYVDATAENLTLPGNDCTGDTPPPPPPTGFVKVDDFNNLSSGAINGRNGWSAGSTVEVVTDPTDANNPVLQLRTGAVEAYKALPNALLNNDTGTLHFRIRRDGAIDGFAGASDLTTPTDWSAFEIQFGAQSNRPATEFVARNGAAFSALGNGFLDRTWFCVWFVANNLNNSYELYLQGGGLTQPTKLTNGAQSLWAFRNGGSDPLRTFFTRLHQSSQGQLLLDDIYLDPAAQNLSTPLTSCGQSSNNPPDAVDDSFTLDQNSSNNLLNVLANDSTLPDANETLTLVTVATPNQGGSAAIMAGQIQYTPRANFAGQERFTYTVSDGNGGSDTATVLIDVMANAALNLSIASMEVSQAIQTISNDVPLVANRPTIVRVAIAMQGGSNSIDGVTAQLYGTRNGVPLPGSPLAPINDNITINRQPNRESLGDLFAFQLPQTWLSAGTITLWAEVNSTRTLLETSFADNTSAQRAFDLIAVPPLEVVLIPIAYQRNGQGPIFRPTLNDRNKLGMGMLQKLFPISEIRHQIHAEYYFNGDLSTDGGWGRLIAELAQLRQQERPNEPNANNVAALMPKYYGVIPMEGAYWGGMAYLPGTTGMGLVEQDDVAAHEIGHNMGLWHVESSVCNQNPGWIDPAYPYPNSAIGHVGVDTFDVGVIADETRDMMSYCWPKWISDYHYKRLLSVLRSSRNRVAQAAQRNAHQLVQPALLISGRIAADEQSATLNNALPITLTGEMMAPPDGSYDLLLIDQDGNVQFSQPFDPAAIEESGTTAQPSDFGFAVPRIANLAAIQVRKDGVVLASLTAGAKPQLTATAAPDAGDAKKLLVSWQVSNAPSAHVNLRYSSDDGQSWQLIALGQTQSPFSLDLSRIPGGSNAKIEVIASTATESAATILSIGEVSDKAPVVAILERDPVEFAPNEVIILLGTAVDYEDGTLSGNSLQWFTSDNRLLGAGSTLILPSLPVGSHTIRLQATDKAGHIVNTSIRIVIKPSQSNQLFLPMTLR